MTDVSKVSLWLMVLLVFGLFRADADEPAEAWVETVQAPQYFALYVEDVDRSVAWYRRAFGVEPLGGSAADDGSWRIENVGNEKLLIEIIRDSRAQRVDRAMGFRKVGFYVPNLEGVADRIERATGERPRIVELEALDQRILQLRDPDGNVIQLLSVRALRD